MSNLLITTYFTKIKDPQRNINFEESITSLMPLINSIKNTKLVILTDSLEEVTGNNYSIIKVNTSLENPYFQRWFSIYEYLEKIDKPDYIFCIDGTDVEVLKNFDISVIEDKLVVGDERPYNYKTNPWIQVLHKSPIIQNFCIKNINNKILNAGILGGKFETVMSFLLKFKENYELISPNLEYTDMGLFNYVIYSFFQDDLLTGEIVNTEFRKNEYNDISWFKHK